MIATEHEYRCSEGERISDGEGRFSGDLDKSDIFRYSAANIGDPDRGRVTEPAEAAYWDDDGNTGLCFADNGI